MPLISLTHIVAIGSTACKLAAEISKRRPDQRGGNVQLNYKRGNNIIAFTLP